MISRVVVVAVVVLIFVTVEVEDGVMEKFNVSDESRTQSVPSIDSSVESELP